MSSSIKFDITGGSVGNNYSGIISFETSGQIPRSFQPSGWKQQVAAAILQYTNRIRARYSGIGRDCWNGVVVRDLDRTIGKGGHSPHVRQVRNM